MATAKKSTKVSSAKTAKAVSAPKKKTTHAASTAKSHKKGAATVAPRAFIMPSEYNDTPFFTFRITHQTVYWGILCAVVLALGLWVVSINDKVMRIYDQIDQTNAATESYTLPTKAKN